MMVVTSLREVAQSVSEGLSLKSVLRAERLGLRSLAYASGYLFIAASRKSHSLSARWSDGSFCCRVV
jgi:hypothetical protein